MKLTKNNKLVFALGNVIIIGLFLLLIVYWYADVDYLRDEFAVETDKTFMSDANDTVIETDTTDPFVEETNVTFADDTFSIVERRRNAKSLRILCMVLTYPKNHAKKAIFVKRTWGRKCNIFLLMSTKYEKTLNNVVLNVTEGRKLLWNKVKKSFKYVYDNYFEEADWFYKADDDTYAIIDNMKLMLSNYNTSEPLFFGRHFKLFLQNGYMSGGAGYVLSKEALRRLKKKNFCEHFDDNHEDVGMGRCMQELNVTAGDSRDEQQRETFLPDSIENSIFVTDDSMTYSYSKYPVQKGLNCCSDYLISAHYIAPQIMYKFGYLLYNVKIASEFSDNSLQTLERSLYVNETFI